MSDQDYNFIWVIYNYHLSIQEEGECYRSPPFYIDHLEGTIWCIEFLYFNGDEDKKIFSCYLCRQDRDEGPVKIQVHAKIVMSGNVNRLYENEKIFTFEKGEKHGWLNFAKERDDFSFREKGVRTGHLDSFKHIEILLTDLAIECKLHRFCPFEYIALNEENLKIEKKWGDILAINGIDFWLTPHCRYFKNADSNVLVSPVNEQNISPHACTWMLNRRYMKGLKSLSDCLKALLQSGHYTDLILYTKDSEFKVHKAIVESRFPKLSVELNLDKVETGTMKRTLPGVTNAAMKSLLNYIYSGILDISPSGVLENLHNLSEKFHLPDLECHLHSPVNSCEVSTTMNIETVNFQWPIKDISLWSVESPPLTRTIETYELDDYKIFVSISLKETDEQFNRSIEIVFNLLDFAGRNKTICGKMSVSGSKSDPFEFLGLFTSTEPYVVMHKLTKEDLFVGQSLQDDMLILDFSIDLCNGIKRTAIVSQILSSNNCYLREYFGKLSEDMLCLYTRGKFCDFVLVAIGDKEFPIHKIVLAARSKVFAKMLVKNIDIKDIYVKVKPEVMDIFLRYIYSGVLENLNKSTADEIQYCSEFFDIGELGEKCYSYLQSITTSKPTRSRYNSGPK